MNELEKTIHNAERKCQEHGARLTRKRKLVLSSLISSQKALSAYELTELVKLQHEEPLQPMSVYRILEFLEQEQLVHKLNLANKFIACSHINCNHRHDVPQFLICCKCQRVEEVTLSSITVQELEKNVGKAGFQLVSPQLEVNCVCDACADKAA